MNWRPRDATLEAVTAIPDEILAESSVLFDDVRLAEVDAVAHAPFVIARVLDRGTLRSVAALLQTYGAERIRSFFREGGGFQVSPRTLALWTAYLGLSEDECTSRSSPGRRSPFWKD